METDKRLTWKINEMGEHHAYNHKDENLGCLAYEKVGQWMNWCWYQFENIRMSPGCLQEVRDKQKELKRGKNDENKN